MNNKKGWTNPQKHARLLRPSLNPDGIRGGPVSLATIVAIALVFGFCLLLAGIIFASVTAKNDPEAGVWLEHHEVPADYMIPAVNVK